MIYIAILLLLAMPAHALELTYTEQFQVNSIAPEDITHQAVLVGPHLALAPLIPVTDAYSSQGKWCWYMADWTNDIKAMVSATPHKGIDVSEKPQVFIDFLSAVLAELQKDGGALKVASKCK